MTAIILKIKVFVIGTILLSVIFIMLQNMKTGGKYTNENSQHVRVFSIDVSSSTRLSEGFADLRILVLTFNRPKSLLRLLTSLQEADYMNDKVILEIWIDRNKNEQLHSDTLIAASNFSFSKGHKLVYTHVSSVGLLGQWIDTWRPNPSSKEIAVILEDDLTVSKFFYRYLKQVHCKYNNKNEINGFSLHVLREKAGFERNANTGIQDIVLLYPILDSWGFSPKQDHWMAFVRWYKHASVNTTFQPFVPGLVQTEWYKIFLYQGRADSMWTMWHIYYSWRYQHYTLYPNFRFLKGLSKNWKEPGLHFKKSKHNGHNSDILVDDWKEDGFLEQLPDTPVKIKYK